MSEHPKKPIRIMGLIPGDRSAATVRSALEKVDGADVEVHRQTLTDVRMQLVNGHRPDVLFVELDSANQEELSALSEFVAQSVGRTAVIATAERASDQDVRNVMRAGVAEFLPQPMRETDVLAAVRSALLREAPLSKPAEAKAGRVVSFLRCAGGAGATTLAVETACELQGRIMRGGRRACYLDLDLQFGNAAMLLDLQPETTILNAVEHAEGLDPAFLNKLFGRHATGLEVLAAPREVIPLDALTPAIVLKVLQAARETHDVVFVDLPLAWSDWSLAVLKESDLGVVVTGLSIPDLDRTTRMLNALNEQGLHDLEIELVATRVPRFWSRARVAQAERVLKRKIDFCIVKDEGTVQEAHDRGVLFSTVRRGSRIERDVRAFANGLETRMATSASARPAPPTLRI